MKRRDFAKTMAGAMVGLMLPGGRARGDVLAAGLSDPYMQPKFAYPVPDAMSPGFKFMADAMGRYSVSIRQTTNHYTGLVHPRSGRLLKTTVWGYGDDMHGPTWPGRTFEVQSASAGGSDETMVRWSNELTNVNRHLLPVDTSLHWCYSLHGDTSANGVDYRQYSIKKNGVPVITHLHGGNTDYQYDGNPEFFYTPDNLVRGPQWDFVEGGFTKDFRYNNHVPAGSLWYHDHALGITRLNVYAGLAGFYFVRDDMDTGLPDNPLGLPAWPYEKAYAIQDRMFRDNGDLFYPAFPGDPFYDEFITEAGIVLEGPFFRGGGPTALAEFFGDHMVVNGVIWPKEDVEPRNYRLRLLNGCDSRFMVIRFRPVPAGATTLDDAGSPIPFHVIGSDQGLGTSAVDDNGKIDTLVFEPGGRYDLVFDFRGLQGMRVIMENAGGDAPFGGEYGDPEDYFSNRQTDRIMAFDVADMTDFDDGFDVSNVPGPYVNNGISARTRKVALFEGMDEYGRLQPLLGVAEETEDASGATVNGSLSWFQPTTENPGNGDTEIWEIYNATGDAHPVHLHLVKFQILGRYDLEVDTEEKDQPQHSGGTGTGYIIEDFSIGGFVDPGSEYAEDGPKDMVTALPEQVTRIQATFDKPGRYVWHCHILSHEDHEMMRVLHVVPGA